MVGIGINMVNSKSVGAQFLHEVGIPLALLRVNERVFRDELVSDSWQYSVT